MSRSSGCCELGVEGIKVDDGDGYYIGDEAVLADGRTGAQAAWDLGTLHRVSIQRALDEVHPGAGVLLGRSGWTGQQAVGLDVGRRPAVGLLVAARCCWSRP